MAAVQPVVTVGAALERARQRLAHLESARRDAEILLAAVLDTRRESFYADPDRVLPQDRAADFHSLIEHRCRGYPVAYLTGRREFWSMEFQVNRYTLIPRPETETLVETVLELLTEPARADVLDLGTGSGVIALALARERPGWRITASDISREALAMARLNADQAGLKDIRFTESDWFSELGRECFDLVACNPPYVESGYPGLSTGEIRYEPRLALDGGVSGLQAIRRIIPAALRRLNPGGRLILEHGHIQGEAVRSLFLAGRYRDVRTRQDLAGLDRVTVGTAP